MKTTRKVLDEKLQQIKEDTMGTNWAGNQSSNAGSGVPLKAIKEPPPPKKEDPIDPEDVVKLGGITPVIFNPTMAQSENKTDPKDIDLARKGQAVIKKDVTESINEMTRRKAQKTINKFWSGKKVKSKKLDKALDKKIERQAKWKPVSEEQINELSHEKLNAYIQKATPDMVKAGFAGDKKKNEKRGKGILKALQKSGPTWGVWGTKKQTNEGDVIDKKHMFNNVLDEGRGVMKRGRRSNYWETKKYLPHEDMQRLGYVPHEEGGIPGWKHPKNGFIPRKFNKKKEMWATTPGMVQDAFRKQTNEGEVIDKKHMFMAFQQINKGRRANFQLPKKEGDLIKTHIVGDKLKKKVNEGGDPIANLALGVLGIGGAMVIRHKMRKAAEAKAMAKVAAKSSSKGATNEPQQQTPKTSGFKRWGGDTRADQLGINALKRHLANRRALGVATGPLKGATPQQKGIAAQQISSTPKVAQSSSQSMGPWGPRSGSASSVPKIRAGISGKKQVTGKPLSKIDQEKQDTVDSNSKFHADWQKRHAGLAAGKSAWEAKWGSREKGIADLRAANTPQKWHEYQQRDWPADKKTPFKPEGVSGPLQAKNPQSAKSGATNTNIPKRMKASELKDLLKKNPNLKATAGKSRSPLGAIGEEGTKEPYPPEKLEYLRSLYSFKDGRKGRPDPHASEKKRKIALKNYNEVKTTGTTSIV